ncbi:hypothetical protein Nepgr_031365 [Nepenthes gracilis]|uniref:WEB family protein n=1 Tax=Nepenthes gracilis TaxID=150966 RepID=A0AAD3TIP1_NEPGR|nr:hypothetical protein Nepgr_031365 [Nepenthes gracilis]
MSMKSKSSFSDTSDNKTLSATPKVAKTMRGVTKSDSDSPSPFQNHRLSIDRSPRTVTSKPVIDRRSPRVSTPPEKPQSRILKPSEFQAQLTVAQEDLKKAKEKLVLVEKEKAQAIDELKEVKKSADEANEKLQEALVAQKRAEESSEIDKFRATEIEQAGIENAQKKEQEWKKELEAVRNHNALDVTALLSTTQELQRFKQELAMMMDAKNQALSHADDATKIAEFHAEKVEILSAEVVRLKGLLDSRHEMESNENKVLTEMKSELDFLKHELEKTEGLEEKLARKEESYEQLNVELEASRMAESHACNLLEEMKSRAKELELQIEHMNRLERSASESLGSVMKQLEGKSDLLHEAECEIASLKEKVVLLEISVGKQKSDLEDSSLLLQKANEEAATTASIIESLKFELEVVKEEKAQALANEILAASSVQGLLGEKNRLVNELDTLREEEEKSKQAMESLASALHEVSAEARETKERLLSRQSEHKNFETQIENLKLALKATSDKYEIMLDEAKKKIDHLTTMMDQSNVELENQIEDLRLILKATNEKYESMLDQAKHEIDHLNGTLEKSKMKYENSKTHWEEKELQLVSCVKKMEEEKLVLKATIEKYETILVDARHELNHLANMSEKSKVEYQSTKAEWEQKELQLVNCVKRSEEEKFSVEKEIVRLVNLLRETEERVHAAEEEVSQLRNSLTEARSEVTCLKDALEKTQAESMKLRVILLDKENEYQNVMQDNRQLRAAEDANVQKLAELSMLLEEATDKNQNKENGKLSESEREYDLLPKLMELSEENGRRSEDKHKMDHLTDLLKDTEKAIPLEMNVLNEEAVQMVAEQSEDTNGKSKATETKEAVEGETVESESKMWESCKIEERDFTQEREAGQELIDDELESMAETGESFDETNGTVNKSRTSSMKQQQKKKKPLYRKFGSLLKKGIGNPK